MGMNVTADEDYIDMEITTSSPSKTHEFEFQMTTSYDTEPPTTADELFYKGHLLPLHQILHPCATATNTPLCSSPPESRRASCDNDTTLFEWSDELTSFIKNHETNSKNSWSKKLKLQKQKLIKQSIFIQKLKSSRAYLRSLFTKSEEHINIGRRIADIIESAPRRSFSGAIKRHSPTKCLSSSSSSSSSNSSNHELNFLRRSCSAPEVEGSIAAAIAHCKKSFQSNNHGLFYLSDDSKIKGV